MSKAVFVPKRRFPEFREAGVWDEKPLSKVCKMNAGEFVPASKIAELPNKNLFHCYGGNGLRGFTETYTHDGVFSLIGRQGALCGNVTLATGRFHATEHAIVTFPSKNTATSWLYYQLVLLDLNRFATGQAQPGLSVKNLNEIPVFIPKDKDEQQKIADCLTSVDDLITAETQKLDTLKDHKKGLMQQLFPREGETKPRIRFPKFRGKEGWDEESLESLYSFHVTNSFSRDQLTSNFGEVRNIHYGDIHTKFSSHLDIVREKIPYIIQSVSLEKIKLDSFCKDGDVVFADASEDIDDVGKCIELMSLNNERVLSGSHTILARQKEKRLVIGFAGHLFQSRRLRSKIQNEAQGAKVLGVSGGRLACIEVCFPKDKGEQQKITDCLTSVDDLITAGSKKLEALKDHKKGLMQQLFPASVEG